MLFSFGFHPASHQWDILLLEAGFLAIFASPLFYLKDGDTLDDPGLCLAIWLLVGSISDVTACSHHDVHGKVAWLPPHVPCRGGEVAEVCVLFVLLSVWSPVLTVTWLHKRLPHVVGADGTGHPSPRWGIPHILIVFFLYLHILHCSYRHMYPQRHCMVCCVTKLRSHALDILCRYAHQLLHWIQVWLRNICGIYAPRSFLSQALSVVATLVIEIGLPFLFFVPSRFAHSYLQNVSLVDQVCRFCKYISFWSQAFLMVCNISYLTEMQS